MTAIANTQIRKLIDLAKEAAIAGNSSNLRALFDSLQSEHPALGWLAYYDCAASGDSPLFSRVLAFFLAQNSREANQHPLAEGCRLWLLHQTGVGDVSLCINQLTALQLAMSTEGRLPMTAQTSVLPFVKSQRTRRDVTDAPRADGSMHLRIRERLAIRLRSRTHGPRSISRVYRIVLPRRTYACRAWIRVRAARSGCFA